MYKTEKLFLGSVGVEPTFKNAHIFLLIPSLKS
jgi:hypothetical protein